MNILSSKAAKSAAALSLAAVMALPALTSAVTEPPLLTDSVPPAFRPP